MAAESIPAINTSASRVPSQAPSAGSGVWERFTSWASENKKVVYTVAGITFIATSAGVIYYLSSPPTQSDQYSKKSKKEKRKARKEVEDATSRLDSSGSQPSVETEEELPEVDETSVASLSEEV